MRHSTLWMHWEIVIFSTAWKCTFARQKLHDCSQDVVDMDIYHSSIEGTGMQLEGERGPEYTILGCAPAECWSAICLEIIPLHFLCWRSCAGCYLCLEARTLGSKWKLSTQYYRFAAPFEMCTWCLLCLPIMPCIWQLCVKEWFNCLARKFCFWHFWLEPLILKPLWQTKSVRLNKHREDRICWLGKS